MARVAAYRPAMWFRWVTQPIGRTTDPRQSRRLTGLIRARAQLPHGPYGNEARKMGLLETARYALIAEPSSGMTRRQSGWPAVMAAVL